MHVCYLQAFDIQLFVMAKKKKKNWFKRCCVSLFTA